MARSLGRDISKGRYPSASVDNIGVGVPGNNAAENARGSHSDPDRLLEVLRQNVQELTVGAALAQLRQESLVCRRDVITLRRRRTGHHL